MDGHVNTNILYQLGHVRFVNKMFLIDLNMPYQKILNVVEDELHIFLEVLEKIHYVVLMELQMRLL